MGVSSPLMPSLLGRGARRADAKARRDLDRKRRRPSTWEPASMSTNGTRPCICLPQAFSICPLTLLSQIGLELGKDALHAQETPAGRRAGVD